MGSSSSSVVVCISSTGYLCNIVTSGSSSYYPSPSPTYVSSHRYSMYTNTPDTLFVEGGTLCFLIRIYMFMYCIAGFIDEG